MVTAAAIYMGMLFAAPQEETVSLRVWAVECSREGRAERDLDAGAREVQDALADLNFDAFRTIRKLSLVLSKDKDLKETLSEKYTLVMRYAGRGEDNRPRVAVRVELTGRTPEEAPRKVVETTLLLSTQKARIGGLRTEKGEMVLVLALT